jgi:hypothetical protein
MDKFEYKSIDCHLLVTGFWDKVDIEKFNNLGNDGWEFICIVNKEFIFKRKIFA